MDQLIVRMLPAEIRARHGEELADMLTCSSRPLRDRADVVLAGLGLRLGHALRPLLVGAVISLCALALGLAHVVGHLQHGATEIPDHWWSMFIASALVGSFAAAIALRLALVRATAWRRRS